MGTAGTSCASPELDEPVSGTPVSETVVLAHDCSDIFQ